MLSYNLNGYDRLKHLISVFMLAGENIFFSYFLFHVLFLLNSA